MARSAGALRQLELGLETIRSLGRQGSVGARVPRVGRPRSGMAVAGQHGHSCPPTRGGRKKGGPGIGPQNEALGRSRGGFSTKLHVSVSGLGLPVELKLTPGQRADVTQGQALLTGYQPRGVIADKGYESDALVEVIEPCGAETGIPAKHTRSSARGH